MKYIISIYIILSILLLTGCKKTSKLQVRGVGEYPKAICLRELEKQNCKSFLKCTSKKDNKNSNCLSDGKIPIACDLWDYSIEKFNTYCDKGTPSHKNNKITVGIIEFNEKGIVNQQQLNQTLELFTNIDKTRPKNENPLVILFAHGWRHGPQVCDENLACFRSVLKKIKGNAKFEGNSNREIIGIFLGWRGQSYTGFNHLTLFSRKNIAQRIGKNDGLQVLLKIDEIVRVKNAELISVGHSLGAALIFTAVQHKLVTSVGKEKYIRPIGNFLEQGTFKNNINCEEKEKSKSRAFGDLVILVNPAIEAWEFKPFHEDTNRGRKRICRPEMIVLASKSDWAVRGFFPASRIVQYSWRPKNIFKGVSNLTGMGHYDKHITHTLKYQNEDDKTPMLAKGFERDNKIEKKEKKDNEDEVEECKCNYIVEDETRPIGIPILISKKIPASNSEFLVIETDKSVIPEHSAIYTPQFIDFLIKVYNNNDKIKYDEIDQNN